MKKHNGEELYKLQKSLNISEYQLAKKLGDSRANVHSAIYHYKKKNGLLRPQIDGEPDTIIREDDGTLSITHTSDIRSLDDLIKAFSIDTERWKAKTFIAEKWDSATDHSEKFLIKATFVERSDKKIPQISPIEVKIPERTHKEYKNNGGFQRSFALFDAHFGFRRDVLTGKLTPFHNRLALSTALEIIESAENVTSVIFGGDFLDLAEWSDKFVLEPEFYFTTQHALQECAYWLALIRSAVRDNTKVVYINGNHEQRVETLVTKRMLSAYAIKPADIVSGPRLMSVESLLRLKKIGIECVSEYPNGEYWICGDTKVEHGNIIRSKPGATSTAVLDNATSNIIFGHKHTSEMSSKSIVEGKNRRTVSAMCGGCLCKTDGSVPGSNKNNDWQNAIVEIVHDGKRAVAINQILIGQDGAAYYNGNIIPPNLFVTEEAEKSVL